MSNRFNRRQFVAASTALATAAVTKLVAADGQTGLCGMNVTKSLRIPSPYAHVAVYATDQVYTHNTGLRLLETVAYEAKYRGNVIPCLLYYRKEAFRRISPDNGRTWTITEPSYEQDPTDAEHEQFWPPGHFRDPETGFIVAISIGFRLYEGGKETYSDAGTISRTRRLHYQISRNGGLTFSPRRPLIHRGHEYDEKHWGPGLYYGKNGGMHSAGFIKLDDDTILHSLVVELEDGKRYQSGLLRGRWTPDKSDIDWEFSDYITVPLHKSSQGACEPYPIQLADRRILVVLRCCGDRENKTFPSLKYHVVSDDDGRSFSEPVPLTYDDGSPVWSPSSFHAFIRSSKNGRVYWIANILPEPTYSSYPRHPLCIAELDEKKLCIIRNSVTTIQALPDDAPQRRRYTNFGMYEDRETQEIVLALPEQPKTSWEDFTADCVQYRIAVG